MVPVEWCTVESWCRVMGCVTSWLHLTGSVGSVVSAVGPRLSHSDSDALPLQGLDINFVHDFVVTENWCVERSWLAAVVHVRLVQALVATTHARLRGAGTDSSWAP